MADTGRPSTPRRVYAVALLLIGAAVFAIRLLQPGPYALPGGGNLIGGILALLLGAWLIRDRLGSGVKALRWAAIAASPVVLYLALYATLAELEEVVVLVANDREGRPAELRLWIVDRDDGSWVTMRRAKADAHGLDQAQAELRRQGQLGCVIATRYDDRATVEEIYKLRHGKYAVQRVATSLGLFSRSGSPDTVALRLTPCPSP